MFNYHYLTNFLFNFIFLRKNVKNSFLVLIYYSYFVIFIKFKTSIVRINKYGNLNR